MSRHKKLLLIGAGGHCRSVLDSIEMNQYENIGIIDLPERIGESVFSVPIIGSDGDISDLYRQGYTSVAITLGSTGDTSVRRRIYAKLQENDYSYPCIIDKTAIISKQNVRIGKGVFIAKGAIINTGVSLGDFSIINSGAVIDHDSRIGDFVHIAPGVSLSGGVDVGDDAHIGTGSSVIQSVFIGESTIIGAGSVVTRSIAPKMLAFGVPCKVYKEL